MYTCRQFLEFQYMNLHFISVKAARPVIPEMKTAVTTVAVSYTHLGNSGPGSDGPFSY